MQYIKTVPGVNLYGGWFTPEIARFKRSKGGIRQSLSTGERKRRNTILSQKIGVGVIAPTAPISSLNTGVITHVHT
jgi:hypothetical protein